MKYILLFIVIICFVISYILDKVRTKSHKYKENILIGRNLLFQCGCYIALTGGALGLMCGESGYQLIIYAIVIGVVIGGAIGVLLGIITIIPMICAVIVNMTYFLCNTLKNRKIILKEYRRD